MGIGRYSHDVAVDDLYHTCHALVGRKVEALRFNTCMRFCLPFEMLRGHLSVWFQLIGNRLDRGRSVLGLFCASNICEASWYMSEESDLSPLYLRLLEPIHICLCLRRSEKKWRKSIILGMRGEHAAARAVGDTNVTPRNGRH